MGETANMKMDQRGALSQNETLAMSTYGKMDSFFTEINTHNTMLWTRQTRSSQENDC